jgi:hypothetical protein
MRVHKRNRQSGVALIFTMFALVLLSALAASLVLVATTETSINYNYRSEQSTFFAARAGVAEAADRMMSINGNGNSTGSIACNLPTAPPTSVQLVANGCASAPAGGVLYLINQGAIATTVQPWVASTTSSPNPYMDDELCHDGYTISGMTTAPPDVPCTTVPSGSSWYTTVTSNAPWSGTAAALPYVWARITLKLNGSVPHLNPGTTSTTDYYVNSTLPATTPICWNGISEVVGNATPVKANTPSQYCPNGDTNVYLITALAVSSSGSRTMVQSEVTVNSAPGTSFGLFANSNACPAITFSGNGITDSYTTAGYTSSTASGAYSATKLQTGGDIGTNGTVNLSGNASIGGSIGAVNATQGPVCPDGLTTSGSAGIVTGQTPPNTLMAIPHTVFAPPAAPNPPTPNTSVTIPNCSCLAPGLSYGNISLSGKTVLTIAPGIYNMNSLTISGQAGVVVSPPGSVIINLGGTGVSTPLNISGQGAANGQGSGPNSSFGNYSYIPNNLVFNYAGSEPLTISGQGDLYAIVDAPLSALTYSGNGGFYGALIGNTIIDSGNGAVHYDRNAKAATITANGNYITLAFRELPY